MFEEEDDDVYGGDFQADLKKFEAMYKNDAFEFLDSNQLEAIIDHFLISGKYNMARWGVEHALTFYPMNTLFKLRKAQILSSAGEIKEALDCLNEVEKLEGKSLEIILTKAACFAQLKDSDSAIKFFTQALDFAEKEDRDEIYLDLSEEYQNINDYKSAIKVLERAVAENAKNEVAVYELAFCYDQLDQFDKAIACFSNYIDENPYSFTAWYNLANAYLKIENYSKAIWAYDYSILINDDFPPAHFNLGNAYLAAEKYRMALECFEKCLETEGEDGLILSYMGECYESLDELDLAMNCYQRSSVISPHLPEAWLGMGIVNDLQGNTSEAIRLILKAIELAPENASFLHVLAGAYENAEIQEKTIEAYEMGVEIDPNNEDMQFDYLKFLLEIDPLLVEAKFKESELSLYKESLCLNLIKVIALHKLGQITESLLIFDEILIKDSIVAKTILKHYPESMMISDFTNRLED